MVEVLPPHIVFKSDDAWLCYSLKIPRLAESLILRKIPFEVRSIIERQSERGFKKQHQVVFVAIEASNDDQG